MDLVSRGSVGLARSWVRTSYSIESRSRLALSLSPSRRHRPLSLFVTATPTRASELITVLFISLCLSRSQLSPLSLSLSFLFFFSFFSFVFLLSPFGFGLLRAEIFFFFGLTWVMGSGLSWPDDGLGEGGPEQKFQGGPKPLFFYFGKILLAKIFFFWAQGGPGPP